MAEFRFSGFFKTRQLRKEGIRVLKYGRKRLPGLKARMNQDDACLVEAKLNQLEEALPDDNPKVLEKKIRDCRKTMDGNLPLYQRYGLRESIRTFVFALVLALVLRSEFVQASYVPSGSMLPTIEIGDQLIVNKLAYGLRIPFIGEKIFSKTPNRGDVIVFQNPTNPSIDFIKRLVGLPGDEIKIRGDQLVINGKSIDKTWKKSISSGPEWKEVYTEKLGDREHLTWYRPGKRHLDFNPDLAKQYNYCRLEDSDDPWLVCNIPEGQYFFMGDNRDSSNDSRFWGLVPENNLRGEALMVHFAWPPKQFRRIGTILD